MRFSLPSLASLAALLVLATATLAHADTLQTFNLTGTMAIGSVSGSVTLDQTTGLFTSESSLFITSTNGTVTFNEAATTTGFTNGFSYAQFQNGSFTAYIEINQPNLIGYNGGQLCTTAATCPGGNVSQLLTSGGNFIAGSLTPVSAATPEPSSLMLLGTGTMGLLGAARRRFFQV